MDPQTLATIRIVLTFALGILASRGLISRETAEYLAGPETMAVLGVAGLLATGGWALWSNRPHARLKAVAVDLDGKGVIVTDPATAATLPHNVVGSIPEAEKVVGGTA